MTREDAITLIDALNSSGTRYLIVGGLAVVAHGYLRFTADVDIILDLSEENIKLCLAALRGLNYRPRLPVDMDQFADNEIRRQWVEQKHMQVFSLFSDQHAATEVDLFVDNPIPFDEMSARAMYWEIVSGTQAACASLADLIYLKRMAGRTEDLQDIRELERIGGPR